MRPYACLCIRSYEWHVYFSPLPAQIQGILRNYILPLPLRTSKKWCYRHLIWCMNIDSWYQGAAHHWIDQFHIDGMRLDAVAAMIYKNFGKEEDGDAIMAGKAGGKEGKVKVVKSCQICLWISWDIVACGSTDADTCPSYSVLTFLLLSDKRAVCGYKGREAIPSTGRCLEVWPTALTGQGKRRWYPPSSTLVCWSSKSTSWRAAVCGRVHQFQMGF